MVYVMTPSNFSQNNFRKHYFSSELSDAYCLGVPHRRHILRWTGLKLILQLVIATKTNHYLIKIDNPIILCNREKICPPFYICT